MLQKIHKREGDLRNTFPNPKRVCEANSTLWQKMSWKVSAGTGVPHPPGQGGACTAGWEMEFNPNTEFKKGRNAEKRWSGRKWCSSCVSPGCVRGMLWWRFCKTCRAKWTSGFFWVVITVILVRKVIIHNGMKWNWVVKCICFSSLKSKPLQSYIIDISIYFL